MKKIISNCPLCEEHSLHVVGEEESQVMQCINCGYVSSTKFIGNKETNEEYKKLTDDMKSWVVEKNDRIWIPTILTLPIGMLYPIGDDDMKWAFAPMIEIPEEESAVGIMGGINFAAEYFRLEARQEFNEVSEASTEQSKIIDEVIKLFDGLRGDQIPVLPHYVELHHVNLENTIPSSSEFLDTINADIAAVLQVPRVAAGQERGSTFAATYNANLWAVQAISRLQKILGVSITASTQFDQVELLANDANPVYEYLIEIHLNILLYI